MHMWRKVIKALNWVESKAFPSVERIISTYRIFLEGLLDCFVSIWQGLV